MVAIVDRFDIQSISNHLDDVAGKGKEERGERDSGHWSDHDLPFNGMTDVELMEEHEIKSSIPIPPPLPPLPGYLTGLPSIPIPPPLPPLPSYLTGSPIVPPLHSPIDLNSNNLCIICFDPNVVIEEPYWNEWDWDPQIQYISSHDRLPCCQRMICKDCLGTLVQSSIDEGRVSICCPHGECGEYFNRDFIMAHCDNSTKEKYNRFLVDVENDGKRKTCPNCCTITEHTLPSRRRLKEENLKITCETCSHQWCFKCHAPWHNNLTCRAFQRGNKDFKKWTRGRTDKGIANCQKCPTCLVYIQRSTGCNHMTCNRCDTEFCYNCGNRFLELGIIDHDSRLNVWGCPENYHPNEPIRRNLVRGGYLTAKISYLAGVPVVLVGACVVIIAGAAVILPIYGSFKLYKLIKYKRSLTRNKQRRTRRL